MTTRRQVRGVEVYEQVVDARHWRVVCLPSRAVYATRPTREECEAVVRDQAALIAVFGRPTIEPPRVTSLTPA